MWPLRSVPPYSSVPWTNHPLVPGPFSIGEKSVPIGGTPLSLLSCSVSPRDVSPPINVSQHVCKTPRALDLAHSNLISVAVQDGELFAVHCVVLAILFDMLKMLHRLPMGHECLHALFRICTHEQLRDLAKTLPWDHPVARSLDHEVHRRRMAGESHLLFFIARVRVSSYPLFS